MNEIGVRNMIGKHMLTDAIELVMDLDKSEGCWIVDKRNGDKYLDLYSMYASQSIGYNHPDLLEIREKLGKVAVFKPSCSDIYTGEMAEFISTFSQIGIPEYLPHAFFIEGGALAVENALKTAFDWKVRKNRVKGHKTEIGHKIIHFEQAFHGRSGYTLSMTNTFSPEKTKYFPKFDWPRITNPKRIFPTSSENIARVIAAENKAITRIKECISREGADIAGLIIEPVQGEGGDNHFRKEFIQALQQICQENEILFIMDEIQTGIGLTGKFWAHEHFDVKPDIISFGKKTQVCGILAGKRIDEIEDNVFQESSRIASTWGGNLIDMVRFTQILKTIKKDNLVENARNQGMLLQSELIKLTQEYPKVLSNARGIGLMCAVDFNTQEKRDAFIKKIFAEKIIVIGCGEKTLRFRPHLIVSENEIKYAFERFRSVLKKTDF